LQWLFRLSARHWLSDETFVGVHKSDDVGRDAPKAAIGPTAIEPTRSTRSGHFRHMDSLAAGP
jgi:hypothetical protein